MIVKFNKENLERFLNEVDDGREYPFNYDRAELIKTLRNGLHYSPELIELDAWEFRLLSNDPL